MAEETFIVLREAMRKTGKVAIARLVLSSRERVITIGARENGMFVCTLRNPERGARHGRVFRQHPGRQARSGNARARRKADRAEDDRLRSQAYEDRYEIALMEMIKEKLKGHKPIVAAAPERGNVINLMDALKASLSPVQAAGEKQVQGANRAKR